MVRTAITVTVEKVHQITIVRVSHEVSTSPAVIESRSMTISEPSRSRRRLLASAATLALGVSMAITAASPASATGYSDRVCGIRADVKALTPHGNTIERRLAIAPVGNSGMACHQVQNKLKRIFPNAITVAGPCATVVLNNFPQQNAAQRCAEMTTQWQPIVTPTWQRQFYVVNQNCTASTDTISSQGRHSGGVSVCGILGIAVNSASGG